MVQVAWPAEDVAKNVRYFLDVVKQATGNAKTSGGEESVNKPRT